ncbi:MAG: hypothetical protein IIC93_06805 [Chloroflexi bacterium]|nr:hypothetical protein [Chloroflexota bacterium]
MAIARPTIRATFRLLLPGVLVIALACGAADDSPGPERSTQSPAPTATPANDTVVAETPTLEPPPELPSGAIALFYRVSFGSDTERITVIGGDIRWETSSKGIVRYIPEIDRYDVIKTISSPSYAKSSIYPITVGGRLYAIRDWGSEWTSKDKHFGIEELDPVTGRTIASAEIYAEWFTISGDDIYYMSEVRTDLFGNATGGGRLMVKNLATGGGSQIADKAERFRAIGGSLISLDDSGVSRHSATTGIARPIATFDYSLIENIWPHIGRIFTGDSAIYWATERGSGVPGLVDVIALYANGETKTVAEIEFDPDETDLIVDEHDGLVLIGAISSSHGRGLAVTSAFILTPGDGEVTEIALEGFIGSSKADAGGGLQLLRLP